MSSASNGNGYVLFARFQASTSGTLTSITLLVPSASGQANVGIYSDNSGTVGSLLTQGTAQSLTSTTTTFTVSGSVTITASSYYWLAFETTGSYYYTSSGLARGYASAACCSLPSTITGGSVGAGSYAISATYSTGPPPADFTITANPTSQSVGAGSTASYALTVTYGSSLPSGTTVNLSVTSGCPTSATCSVNPTSLTASGTSTLTIGTQITTPSNTYSITVTASSSSPSLTHTVTVQLTVSGPGSYSANVHAGATQVIVTVTWSGGGTTSVVLEGPGGTPTLTESGQVVYDRLTYASGSSSPTDIHRVTFNISSYSPSSAQTWTVLVSQSASYTVTIEVS